MKIILALIFLPFFTYSQVNYEIEYDVQLNSLSRKGYLFLNKKSNPHYYEVSLKDSLKKTKSDEDGNFEIKFVLQTKSDKVRRQLYSVKNDTIINFDYVDDKNVAYFETSNTINWELSNETKEISGYSCSKAILSFRGRKYVAWFTTDIPCRFGPWKFINTPGLIMEIEDESKLFSWFIKKIKIVKYETIHNLDFKNDIISIKDFVIMKEKSDNELVKQSMLKYEQRGLTLAKNEYIRGREKTFEWEK